MRNVTTHASWTLALAIAFSLATTRETHADPIVSNFSQASTAGDVYIGMGGQTENAEEFNVGSKNQTLGSIVLQFALSKTPYSGFAELVQDNGSNNPATGTLVTTFTFPTLANDTYYDPTTAEFDPTIKGVTLLANTDYFFILGYTSGSGDIELLVSFSATVDPGSVGTLLGDFDSVNYGSYFYNESPENMIIQVNPASVPEPSSFAMMGIAGGIAIVVARVRRKRSVA